MPDEEMPAPPARSVQPSEVAAVMQRLHDAGIINLESPVSNYMSELRAIEPDSTLAGSYFLAWSSYGLIVRQD